MGRFTNVDHRIAAVLFLLSMVVYAATMSPTISFWDCAEFTASAYTLGIPHQPGTPLYVLVGRVFSMIPLGISVAQKINLMSAFFASLAVAFMYLTGVRLQRGWSDEKILPSPAWIGRVGAAVGALFLAFSTTFWNNAIEAEVYALASFVLAFTAFLSVRWYEIRDHASSATLMLLIVYLMGMSVGFHMGSILIFPGVFVLVMVADRKALKTFDLFLVALVMGAFVLSTMKFPGAAVMAIFLGAIIAAVWRSMTWGENDEIPHNRWFALAGIALFVVGLSVHVFMLIRAHHDPLINQSDVTSFDTLLSVLRREQYPPRSIFEREAPLLWQLGHLWGTVHWQGGQLAGNLVVGYEQQFTFLSGTHPNFADRFVPLALWLLGVFYQLRGNWRMGVSLLTTLLVNSIGLMILLNFTAAEVRDRDYFYAGFYQFAALFLGLGAAGLLRAVWLGMRERMDLVPKLAAAFLVFIAVLPVVAGPFGHPKWFEHDRSHNWIAYHYARNILESVSPNAILCTNGDNDTFPLWYLQEVEGIRTDVRIVNLQLINLPWYIKQLRDYEPRVPITWTDRQIDGKEKVRYRRWEIDLNPTRLPDGSVAYIRDIAMWHIVQNNRWERDIYYAITVPSDQIGQFEPYLSMEGMVFRLTPERSEDGNSRVDTQKMWENFTQVYDFTSVLDENGRADTSIYRDPQTAHLLRNYPASLARIGWFEARDGNYDRAIEALEMAYGFEPSFSVIADILPVVYLQKGEVEKAIDAGRRMLPYHEPPIGGCVQLGEALLQMERDAEAVAWAEELVRTAPDETQYVQLYIKALVLNRQFERASEAIDDWIARTGDTRARAQFDRFIEETRRRVEEQSRAPKDSLGRLIIRQSDDATGDGEGQ